MKVLMIGGTGTISSAITRQLSESGHDLWLLNRGNRKDEVPASVRQVIVDIDDTDKVLQLLGDEQFDAVCEFIGFLPSQVERDIRLFQGRTRQYVYISSASAYNKPAASHVITEGTALANPYWEYSRNKIACEDLLMKAYREEGFPVTIIRPSHTYCERAVPLSVHGLKGSWQVLRRMLDGKRVIIHGDGTSLWTLTHNSDFAKGFIGLMGNPHALGNAFQITSDETLSWNQIYQTIADKLGVELKAVHISSEFLADVAPYDFRGGLIGDKAVTVLFDNTKLKRAVPGFQATVRFEEGVADTIDNILANPQLQVPDPEFDAWCDHVLDVLDKAKASLQ